MRLIPNMKLVFRKCSGIYLLPVLLLLIGPISAQTTQTTVSGRIMDKATGEALPYVNVVLRTLPDSLLVDGGITNEKGRFTLTVKKPGEYLLQSTFIGYTTQTQSLYIGSHADFLEVPPIDLESEAATLAEVTVTGEKGGVSELLDKQTYHLSDNIAQVGGSMLQAMQNLPGITVQDGKIQLRGNDRVTVLIDGKQTALTGFGSQSGLDNLPASAIEKVEIIQYPSAKYEANGNAGIINIILKKEKKEGLNGKVGLSAGVGALWVRKDNLPGIRPQYKRTPKVNPSLSLNYRKKKLNFFLQADNLYTESLYKNEFVDRTYQDGTIIRQQSKRNRDTNFFTSRTGVDWYLNQQDMLSFSGMLGKEKILDRGDQPFFSDDYSERLRLWQYLEDEVKTTGIATLNYQHAFATPGHKLQSSLSYTFHREDEQYFFDNILPDYSGKDAFKLLSDEHVADVSVDYIRPLLHGSLETGLKLRRREIPTNMQFFPGFNSPLDSTAGGRATYKETIPALYGNYAFENGKIDAEIGLRIEYVNVDYTVNPGHNTYKSDGYRYFQPFPNVRFTYKINPSHTLSVFYNRRVDRPSEVDIRIFPKYDDAEIIKVGNPTLAPQFTNMYELGYRANWQKGSLYGALFYRAVEGTITRIATTVPDSYLIYSVFQNAGNSHATGIEMILTQDLDKLMSLNLSMTGYRQQIDAFSVENQYPTPHTYHAETSSIISGNIKLNTQLHLSHHWEVQLTGVYLAPDIIPQGKTGARYSLDMGITKSVQHGKGLVFINATDILNTLVERKEIQGEDFRYTSTDYRETQVFRMGYNLKF
ncbi:outer membrane beta-barrel family protein [Limibacter armeniacum]|uniref:outer membrane beta-barrel family protein n=1 Tax=Limibacter armeniacum TaxID=466084 RepID=UPI002FE62E93